MIKQVSLVRGLMSLPKVCVSLSGNTLEEMLEDAALATAAGADIIEVRFDNLWLKRVEVIPEGQVEDQRKSRTKKWEYHPLPLEEVSVDACIDGFKTGITIPYIFTCRPRRQGGNFPGDELGRIAILESAIQSGASYIDLEIDIDSEERSKLVTLAGDLTKVIASEHGGAPPTVDEILTQVDEMSSMGSIVKICYRLTTKGGALRVLEASKIVGARDGGPDVALMGTGEGGDWTRIHAPIIGSSMVYSTMQDSFDVIRQGKVNFEDLYIAWDLLEYE